MAMLKRDAPSRDTKSSGAASTSSPLARVMYEFEQLVKSFEAGLLLSLQESSGSDHLPSSQREHIHHEACRLAVSDLSTKYTRKYIRRSLDEAEAEGKRVEELLHNLTISGGGGGGGSSSSRSSSSSSSSSSSGGGGGGGVDAAQDEQALGSLHNGYFRLYSTELFDHLGQPTDLRFGTLRFHKHPSSSDVDANPLSHVHDSPSPWVTVELALSNSFFVADSLETLPYHTFRLPATPSLQNRGILSRKPEDGGAFPAFDSWLLFTFLGNGCIKLEVPVEMCADVYGGRLQGRENEEVLFWGFFVDDDVPV